MLEYLKQPSLSILEGYIFSGRQFKMQSIISIRFERCISLIITFREFKKILWNFAIFWQCFKPISKNAYWIEYNSINFAIIYKHNFRLFTKQKYCKAIMDDLLLFTPTKKSHIDKLKDLLKALLKMDLRFPKRNVNFIEKNYNT